MEFGEQRDFGRRVGRRPRFFQKLVNAAAQNNLKLSAMIGQPGKRPTKEQLAWSNVVRGMGGFAAVVTSVDEAIAAVERAMSGDSQ